MCIDTKVYSKPSAFLSLYNFQLWFIGEIWSFWKCALTVWLTLYVPTPFALLFQQWLKSKWEHLENLKEPSSIQKRKRTQTFSFWRCAFTMMSIVNGPNSLPLFSSTANYLKNFGYVWRIWKKTFSMLICDTPGYDRNRRCAFALRSILNVSNFLPSFVSTVIFRQIWMFQGFQRSVFYINLWQF